MIEETIPDIPNFFSMNGYTFYYNKQVLKDFNGELYNINTGLSQELIANNPDLYDVLAYFSDLARRLNDYPDIKEKCQDTLDFFISQLDD